MEIGKLPNDMLNRLILEPIKKYGIKPPEVLTLPSVGEDCAALNLGDNLCILSTDPITGAAEDIGEIAVNINANDIASAGGEAIGLMVTALLPPYITEEEIAALGESLYKSANKAGIAVLGGHTEITDAVVRPVVSCTVIGKGKRFISSGGARVGDSLIMTKYAAIEGTLILYNDYKSLWENKLSAEEKAVCTGLGELLSVREEGRIAAELGATSMHDVTEGGILGACHEAARCAGLGVTVYTDKIPLLPVTKRICAYCDIDPLRFISSGSMLITAAEGERLASTLINRGINAAVIGTITDKGMRQEINGALEPLEPPEADELYRARKKLKQEACLEAYR